MQLGVPQALGLAVLLAGLRGEKGRLLSGEYAGGGSSGPCFLGPLQSRGCGGEGVAPPPN